ARPAGEPAEAAAQIDDPESRQGRQHRAERRPLRHAIEPLARPHQIAVAREELRVVVDVLRHVTLAAAFALRTASTNDAPRSVSSLEPASSVNLPSTNLEGAAPIITSGLFTNRPSRKIIIWRR